MFSKNTAETVDILSYKTKPNESQFVEPIGILF